MTAWRRGGRVAHIENLRVYLGRQVTATGASRRLAVEAVEALRDVRTARALFQSVDDARLRALLDRIGDYEDNLPIEAGITIPVLYELRQRLPERAGFMDVEPEIRIGRVAYRIVKDSPPEAVAEMLDEVLPQLPLLSDRMDLLRTMGWGSQRAQKMAPEDDLARHATSVTDEALTRPAQELAGEPDLALA